MAGYMSSVPLDLAAHRPVKWALIARYPAALQASSVLGSFLFSGAREAKRLAMQAYTSSGLTMFKLAGIKGGQ